VNVPSAPFRDDGTWLIEGHGFEPDQLIEWDPAQLEDPQLEAAMRKMLAAIAAPRP
jgi:hypothetical protein